MRNIIILTLNDLAIAFKNKSIYLILFIPLFVFISLQLLDEEDSAFQQMRIGLIENEKYPRVIVENLKSADNLFSFFWLDNQPEGLQRLKENKLDGVLLKSEKEPQGVELLVLNQRSLATIAIVESFAALQAAVEGDRPKWLAGIQASQESDLQKQTLPIWILMLVLLVSFIIIPAQLAEEKEKKLLLGVLQTPVREFEWLMAKLFLGITLILLAVIFLHLLGRFEVANILSYGAFIIIGSFCFSSFGIFIGCLCRTQASARSLGIFCYLPLLLPAALSDFSQKLTAFAPLLPSYQFYEPIRAILLDDGKLSDFTFYFLYLLVIGVTTSLFSYQLLKKRWLM
jgi:ABC-2 type transport system permease protein